MSTPLDNLEALKEYERMALLYRKVLATPEKERATIVKLLTPNAQKVFKEILDNNKEDKESESSRHLPFNLDKKT